MAETYIKNLGKVCITPEGVWNKNAQYNRLCLVSLTGEDGLVYSYISRKEVPAGIEIGNTDYWQLVANSFSVEDWGVGEDGYIYIGGVKTDYKIGLNDALADEVVNLLSDRLADLVAGKVDQVIGSKLQQILTEGLKVTQSGKLEIEPTGEVEIECVCNKDSNNQNQQGSGSGNNSTGQTDTSGETSGGNDSGNDSGNNDDNQKYTITIGTITPSSDRTHIYYGLRSNPSVKTPINPGESFTMDKDKRWFVEIETDYSEDDTNYRTKTIIGKNENKTINETLDKWDCVRLRVVDGNVPIDDIDFRDSERNIWDLSSPQSDIIRDKGDTFALFGIKPGYETLFVANTERLESATITTNLNELSDSNMKVTLSKVDTKTYAPSISGNNISVVPHFQTGNSKFYVTFGLFVDTTSGLKVAVPDGYTCSQYYKYANGMRYLLFEFEIGTELPQSPDLGTIKLYKVSGDSFEVIGLEDTVSNPIETLTYSILSSRISE